jgi:crotonobetainyl-CoA:carnitine CoA-transferase CaiB-like acyl-CoA transferase
VKGPLHDLKVLDLTIMLSGPFATMILADLGADVVKVESPDGDLTRASGPYLPDDQLHLFGGYFASVNRNKRSIVIDLKTPGGVGVLERLVETADVLVDNYRAGVLDRLGIGWERLHEINPKLVYATLRGFGDPRTGVSPYVDRPAFDVVIQAMAGLMGVTGSSRDEPMKAGPGLGDVIPAMLLSTGILAALRHAEQTGEGQQVDVAMYDAMVSVCERIVYQYTFTGTSPEPQGNRHPLLMPFELFRATDGLIAIAAPVDAHWRALAQIIGRPGLAEDPRTKTNSARVTNADLVRDVITHWTSTRTRAEVEGALAGAVPVGSVNDAHDIVESEHVAARKMVAAVSHPGSALPARIAASPIKLTLTPTSIRTRAPLLSEHVEEVLGEVGYSTSEIDDLLEVGVVQPTQPFQLSTTPPVELE